MLIRVQDYRVRLPSDLYPYKGKQVIQVKHFLNIDSSDSEWLPIADNFFQPAFDMRNPFNLPGPFYGAETDTCQTGPAEAPNNVLMDGKGQEFVCKQPSNEGELRDIISAALCECFCGYGADGDSHWTLRLIREWWRSRADLLAQAGDLFGDSGTIMNWKRFLLGEGEQFLRAYAFLVEEKRLPREADVLPAVS
jgi:hypothetical protein